MAETTETTKIFFKPSCGSIGQVVMATVPLFSLLVYLLFVAWRRSGDIPYDPPEGATEEELTIGYQAEIDALVPLEQSVWVFMAICFFWAYIAVNLTFFRHKKHNLIRQFLREGKQQLGDVFYTGKRCGYKHRGEVIYPHPNYKQYPIYFRRTVKVHDHYSKEKTTLLLLPNEAKSGHVKSDIETEVKKMDRSSRKMYYIRILAWLWTIFTLFAPIYVLSIMRKGDADFVNYHECKLLYLIMALAVIPIVCLVGNWLAWFRYKSWMTRGDAQTAEEGEYVEWTDVKGVDYEMAKYRPPTPSDDMHSQGSDESPVLVNFDDGDGQAAGAYKSKGRRIKKNHF